MSQNNPRYVTVIREALKGPVRNYQLTEKYSILSPTKVLSDLDRMGFVWDKMWDEWQNPKTGTRHKVLRYTLKRDWNHLNALGETVLHQARRT
jgi:hypothetical protein